MAIDWEQHALKYFFYFHTIPQRARCGTNGFIGYMGFLEDFCQNTTSGSYLHDALHAIALVSIAHRTDLKWLPAKAMTYRASALNSLRQALSNEVEARSDNVLPALFLLERFEVSLDASLTSTNEHVLTHQLAHQWGKSNIQGLVQSF